MCQLNAIVETLGCTGTILVFGAVLLGAFGAGFVVRSLFQNAPENPEVTVTEEDDEWDVQIQVEMKSGRKLIVYCDYIDNWSFEEGTLNVYWEDSGEIAIEDAATGEELEHFDSDAGAVHYGLDDVANVIVLE